MNFLSLIPTLPPGLWGLILIIILVSFFKSPMGKGMVGEFIVNLLAKLFLDKNTYHLIKNVTLPTESGTTQIDHLIVSKYGVFVIETKNMKGWIFGSEKQEKWTQKIYKHSVSFQNPLRQNYKHTKTLATLLNIDHEKIFSLIVFVGDSEFKTKMPENVTYCRGFVKFVRSKKEKLFNRLEVKNIVESIGKIRLKENIQTYRDHVQYLKSLHSTKTNAEFSDATICVESENERSTHQGETGLTGMLVNAIQANHKMNNVLSKSGPEPSIKRRKSHNFLKRLILLKTIQLFGLIIFIGLLSVIAFSCFSLVTTQLSNIFLKKSQETNLGIVTSIAPTDSDLISQTKKNVEHEFSASQIDRAMKELLKGDLEMTSSLNKSNETAQSKHAQKDVTGEKDNQGYLYEITMNSGKIITSDNMLIGGNKVTFMNKRGLIVSINSDAVKSVNKKSNMVLNKLQF